MESREVFKMVFVGKPGTGKTTHLRRLVRSSLEAGRRVLVVTPHENEWLDLPLLDIDRIASYRGARRCLCRAEAEVLHTVCRSFRGGLLIFDDCRAYVPDWQDPEVRLMLLSCRQNDVDFCAVGHGFTTVPPLFFTYATHYCIFATTDNVARRRDCMLDFEATAAAVRRVNQAAIAEPHHCEIIRNL